VADPPSLHDDEVLTDASLVRRLLVARFPAWAELHIEPVNSDGTDNAMYRLGEELAVRLPRRPSAVASIDKEYAWLPRLAPLLPLPLPVPLAVGATDLGYPWSWSVCRWLQGETPTPERVTDTSRLAIDLAAFIRALRIIDAAGAPRPGTHNHGRGAPLDRWQATIRDRLQWLADLEDIDMVSAAWEADAGASAWSGPPVWIHGDLSAANLLVQAGRLGGVIDWSCLGAGDPACELQVAWTLFSHEDRQVFRNAIEVDDATWWRGRAWGLLNGILGLSYYRKRSPVLAERGRRAIDAVLQDRARRGV
jgi:aminoglycoside phosphotransferase (APT) family kinase protein